MEKILALNGLRGVAALMVFLAHAAKSGFLPAFLEKQYGQIALLILFVLSGFLISHQYLYRDFNKESVWNYLLARFARIFPAYLLVLIISFVVSNYFYPEFRYNFEHKPAFFRSLFFLSAPYELWSIPIEVQFYFTFILLWLVHQKFSKNFWLLLSIPLLMLCLGVFFYTNNGKPHTIWLFAITFFIGTTLSFLINNNKVIEQIKKIPKTIVISTLILTILFVPLFKKLAGFHLPARLDPVKLTLVVSSFLFILTNPGNFKFLTAKPLLFLGEISFAFYLVHRPIIEIGKTLHGSTPACFALTLIVTTGIAATSTFLFEKPIARVFKKKKIIA